MTLYSLDGVRGTLDPVCDAYVLPLKHWSMACWDHGLPAECVTAAFERVIQELRMRSGSVWHVVTGPVAAVIASLWRLGWVWSSARVVTDDAGCAWDFLCDSPAAVVAACRRSVRRWRFQRTAAHLPHLVPPGCDGGRAAADGHETAVVDFSYVLAALLRGPTAVKQVPEWSGNCRSALA